MTEVDQMDLMTAGDVASSCDMIDLELLHLSGEGSILRVPSSMLGHELRRMAVK